MGGCLSAQDGDAKKQRERKNANASGQKQTHPQTNPIVIGQDAPIQSDARLRQLATSHTDRHELEQQQLRNILSNILTTAQKEFIDVSSHGHSFYEPHSLNKNYGQLLQEANIKPEMLAFASVPVGVSAEDQSGDDATLLSEEDLSQQIAQLGKALKSIKLKDCGSLTVPFEIAPSEDK